MKKQLEKLRKQREALQKDREKFKYKLQNQNFNWAPPAPDPMQQMMMLPYKLLLQKQYMKRMAEVERNSSSESSESSEEDSENGEELLRKFILQTQLQQAKQAQVSKAKDNYKPYKRKKLNIKKKRKRSREEYVLPTIGGQNYQNQNLQKSSNNASKPNNNKKPIMNPRLAANMKKWRHGVRWVDFAFHFEKYLSSTINQRYEEEVAYFKKTIHQIQLEARDMVFSYVKPTLDDILRTSSTLKFSPLDIKIEKNRSELFVGGFLFLDLYKETY